MPVAPLSADGHRKGREDRAVEGPRQATAHTDRAGVIRAWLGDARNLPSVEALEEGGLGSAL
eukprot:8326641-Alexandrium_andersonii.AAC.1